VINIKQLNTNLCILAGAHAADGYLSKKGLFSISDENKINLELVSDIIKKEFDIKTRIYKVKDENRYAFYFMNKNFTNYFKNGFNFPLGFKTYTVEMPKIIKNNLNFEKAFVTGAMTFESSVNINKSITFSATSKKFRDDLAIILLKNKMNIKTSRLIKEGNRKKQYVLRTSDNLSKEELEKWLNYYIKGSEKWFKVLELSNGFFGKIKNINTAKKAFELTYSKGRNIKINDVINTIRRFKQIDMTNLCKKLNIVKTTISKYLRIIESCNIIRRQSSNLGIPYPNLFNLSESTHITLSNKLRSNLFKRLNKYNGNDAKICRLLKVKDFIYSRWRNGVRGIPTNTLIYLLRLSKIYEIKTLRILKLDRDLISYNKNIYEWRVPWRPWFKNIKIDKNNNGFKKWILTTKN
jgi:hypothetical protein